MSKSPEQLNIIRFTKALEQFLQNNEKWFQKPEENIKSFEKEMDEWNGQFTEQMAIVENWIKELEKRME
ncbi:hypothetical protein [Salirhabdus sp. Marseille-P4669]|uniref:hypothetical protein n=1 Tax=Salirhabdus sp. Marseille-P4669 TaxID=2042310 RepID=UPI001F30165E|nr:hypothetical protein [Salirhabdus sp. Marseille-P4669]